MQRQLGPLLAITLATIAAGVLGSPRTAAAQMQIPDEFMNLQVLPEDISKDDLTAVMRGFSEALGVRCTYCHVVPKGEKEPDFASDDKEAKRDARLMLRMAESINNDTIPKLLGTDGKQQVGCMTCHRGQSSPPRPLAAILFETAAAEGTDAAVARYRELREKDLEAGLYDFRDHTLVAVGQRLNEEGQPEQAIAWLKAAADLQPSSAAVPVALGQVLAGRGDKAAAREAFERALKIDPKSRAAKAGLERLDKPAGPPR